MNLKDAFAAPLPDVDSVAVARLKPSDVIVITSRELLSHEARINIQTELGKACPGHRCIVLSGGLSMEIAKEEG